MVHLLWQQPRTRVKKWKNPEGGYFHAMHSHDWGDFHYRITGKNEKGELQLEGGWQNNRQWESILKTGW